MIVLYLGVAGVAGALLRFSIGLAFNSFHSFGSFPLATLFINYMGCFTLAWLLHAPIVHKRLSETLRTTIGTGLIGSFTTFSAFSVDTVKLLNDQELGTAALYVVLSLCGGLGFAWLGEHTALRSSPSSNHQREGHTP